ncbi:MAG TPA: SDR family oxidoreductase [Acidimicrobiales bacterium]|nr:SDR family oxidoreductase [Acidimicrobiales bacterium]
MTNLDGRTMLVTGAGGGVGRGIAIALAERGAVVALLVRRASTGADVAAEIASRGGRAHSFECDVSDPQQLQVSVASIEAGLGRIHSVVHNAISGRTSQKEHLGALDDASWEDHVSVGLRPCYWLARLTYRSLAAERGSFVVLTSVDGIEGDEDLPLYSTVKAAQRGLVKSLAREWGTAGVRVNGLAPLALTPALERAVALDDTLLARISGLVPLGRFGDPITDIGPAAAFLCSDEARYVTGQTLIVSGGRYTAL